MPLQAITEDMERTFGANVLEALLSPQEIEAEKSAEHPIAVIGMVCGCEGAP